MEMWSRRDFLKVATTSGVSTFLGMHGWTGIQSVRAGIKGWGNASGQVVAALRELPVNVTAVADLPSASTYLLEDWRTAFPAVAPQIYDDVRTMLERSRIDVLYASALPAHLENVPVHLLLENSESPLPHPAVTMDKFVQILPRYEFGGLNRSTSLLSMGDWSRAAIDCRTALPSTRFRDRSEFGCWLYQQIGEALDVVCELMDVDGVEQVFALATPAFSPYSARLGWRLATSESPLRTIDVSVVAAGLSPNQSAGTRILLCSEGRVAALCSAPRSSQLTTFLASNLLESIRRHDPQGLLYHPSLLTRSHDLVTRVAMSI